jgi:hypothetical protein
MLTRSMRPSHGVGSFAASLAACRNDSPANTRMVRRVPSE